MKKLVNISVGRTAQQVAPHGWHASVATATTGTANRVSSGESEIHSSKQTAWDSIRSRVEALDYENDEVRLNGQLMNSAQQVVQAVQQIP
ncbi:MAG: hypothetical protein IPK70_06210 [Flavobacteriales bacterium]|nr:hypothetical protein [Flavobacteriales bacterium]